MPHDAGMDPFYAVGLVAGFFAAWAMLSRARPSRTR